MDIENTIKSGNPPFLLYHHPHSLASLTARLCIEIGKTAHPNARAHIIQIEVVLGENGNLHPGYFNTNSSGAVGSSAAPGFREQLSELTVSADSCSYSSFSRDSHQLKY
jgi:hypothetical protein